jgi:type IV pilus assembly protein PilA
MTNRRRLYRPIAEDGFTLIELLVVIVIIGVLLAIAVPSYIGFRDQAADTAGKANVRTAIPAAEAYYGKNGTYSGMDFAAMDAIDAGLSHNVHVAVLAGNTQYCLDAAGKNGVTWYYLGPGGSLTSTSPSASCP